MQLKTSDQISQGSTTDTHMKDTYRKYKKPGMNDLDPKSPGQKILPTGM